MPDADSMPHLLALFAKTSPQFWSTIPRRSLAWKSCCSTPGCTRSGSIASITGCGIMAGVSVARMLSQVARLLTGIEIHPGAENWTPLLHRSRHGRGDRRDRDRRRRRHALSGRDSGRHRQGTSASAIPRSEDNVVVGGGAKILGNITVGENCRIGAGSVVLRNVPDNSTVVGVPGHIVFREGKRVVITDPKQINDPLSEALAAVATEVNNLRERVQQLEGHEGKGEPIPESLQRIMEDVDYQI